MCHAHVHHHWPLQEVQEEVTALGVALGSRHEPWRTGGTAGVGGGRSSAGVGGGRSTGGCGGIGPWRALRWPLPRRA